MADAAHSTIADWVAAAGLAGKSEAVLLEGFCRRVVEAGVPVARAAVIVDTLHPVHEGRAFRWSRDTAEGLETIEYGPTNTGTAAENWQASAHYHLLETGGSRLRVPLRAGEPGAFRMVDSFADEGMTEYVALINRFAGGGAIGEMDCIYSYWVTDRPGGFADEHVAALEGLMPALALAVKAASLARIAATLVETYLGRDPGRRVFSGGIGRGAAERIHAVLWFSDLRGFTRITDTNPPQSVIALLNDYAEAVIRSIHEEGGDVLKLIGDGVLAIFPYDEPEDLPAPARSRPKPRCAGASSSSTSGARPLGCRRPTCISAFISARCSTAISAATTGSDFTVIEPAVTLWGRADRRYVPLGRPQRADVSRFPGRARWRRCGVRRPLRAARGRAAAGAIYARSPGAGSSRRRSSDIAAPHRTARGARSLHPRPASPRGGCWRGSCARNRPRPAPAAR